MPTMPHGYTNRVTWDGLVVTKSYQGPATQARRDREARALAGLAGRLPVPPLLSPLNGPPRNGSPAGGSPRDGTPREGSLGGGQPGEDLVSSPDGRLAMRLMPGIHGQDLIDAGLANDVLRALGRMLRRIHATDPAAAGIPAPGRPG
jgi:hypothetical protein